MGLLRIELDPTQDVYIDEANPDENYNDADELLVRSQANGNQRTLLEFPTLDPLLEGQQASFTDVEKAVLIAEPTHADPGRVIEVDQVEAFDEDTVTWNTQPEHIEIPLDEVASEDATHAWDVTVLLEIILGEGDALFVIQDTNENDDPPAGTEYASSNATDGSAFRLVIWVNKVTQTFRATEDTYVDEDNPNASFHDSQQLFIRSDNNDNRRTFAGFDFQGIREDALHIERAILRLTVQDQDDDRTLQARPLQEPLNAQTTTWNNQPTTDPTEATTSSDPTLWHEWDITESTQDVIKNGQPWDADDRSHAWGLQDASEDAGVFQSHQQAYASRQHESEEAPLVEVEITSFLNHQDLESTLRVTRSETLPSHIMVLGTRALPSSITPRFSRRGSMFSSVAPAVHPIKEPSHARARGRVVVALPGVLDDLENVISEVGTRLRRDGEPARAIVQLLRDFDDPHPRDRPGNPHRLARGDAILYALGDGSTWTPGTMVEWQEGRWLVVGTLSSERVTGSDLFREVALKRVATTHTAHARGHVRVSVDLGALVEVGGA